ncbi:hypothetical protein [Streptomyces sp. NPDC090994]|uniref:hypothetical protein n=1 Tax=Streptomyces sp. NPDC090994 TaxID=3365969 RepID=UPI0038285C6E
MSDVPLSPRPAGVTARRFLPPPALCGFLLLLALVFSVSYAIGSAAGPVAPGMHGTGGSGGGGDGGGDGTSSTGGGMEDMPGMGHGSGE